MEIDGSWDEPRCPGCAAPLSPGSGDGIVGCDFCGSETNTRGDPIGELVETPSPTLVTPRSGHVEEWRYAEWVGGLARETDPTRRLAIARAMPAFDQNALVWIPRLADCLVGAAAELDLQIGQCLALTASTWRILPIRRQLFRVVRARMSRLPHSRGLVLALSGIGPGALKTILEIAERADDEGDAARSEFALGLIPALVDKQYRERLEVCLDILLYRLPYVHGAPRRFLLHYLADCVDSRYEVAVRDRREEKDFRALIPMVVRFLDHVIASDPDLAQELIEEIARLHTYHSTSRQDSKDWQDALGEAVTEAGRAAVKELVRRLYPPGATFAPPHEFFESDAVLSGVDVPAALAVRGGDVVAGRAPCPACGRPLPLQDDELVVTCPSCGVRVHVPEELRADPELGEEMREFSDELELWTPEQLIQALVEEPDPDRLRDIARELRKPRTDGTRYAPHVKTLVHRLMSRPDEHIELDLVEGIARMIANGGEPFRDALLGEVRALGMGSRGSGRLLHEVATYGIVALPLLLDVACSALEESESTPGGVTYAMSGFNAVGACMRQDGFPLEEGSRLLLSRLPAASPQAANQISQRLGGAFDLELFGGHSLTVQRLVLDAIDAHVDPAGTTYSGMAPDPGCAAFYGVGGPAWVERLVGYLQSMWRAPVNAADLRFRLDALERAQTRGSCPNRS